MKQPVKLTGKALDEVIAKRKNKMITVTEGLTGGNLETVTKQFSEFARDNGVDITDVKFLAGYYSHLSVRRLETDAEKAKRVREDETWKYNDKMNKYKRWLREQEQIQAQIARLQAKYGTSCCPPNCCCRKKTH